MKLTRKGQVYRKYSIDMPEDVYAALDELYGNSKSKYIIKAIIASLGTSYEDIEIEALLRANDLRTEMLSKVIEISRAKRSCADITVKDELEPAVAIQIAIEKLDWVNRSIKEVGITPLIVKRVSSLAKNMCNGVTDEMVMEALSCLTKNR